MSDLNDELKVKGENLLEYEFNYTRRQQSSLTLTKVEKDLTTPVIIKSSSQSKIEKRKF